MTRSRIVGTGSCVPVRIVENEEVGAPLGLGQAKIEALTGIRTRHWAAPAEASSDLAVAAALRACEAAGIAPSSLEAILVSTTSPDSVFPSTACHVQRALAAKGVLAFDLSASCSGFLYGLSMADAMIRAGQVASCLVVASEVKSRSLDLRDKETAILFGDGAGAVVLRRNDDSRPDASGILGLRLYADGAGHDLIKIQAGGSRMPLSTDRLQAGDHQLRMKGSAVFRSAVRRLTHAITELLKEFGLTVADLKLVVAHQANARILEHLQRRLALSASAVHSVIDRYGNTSSASLPIALDDAVRAGRLGAGDVLLMGAFGGGLTWATGVVRW
ncbi:beta-ketoacyl-ACP synthase III [Nitrospirales bacterium NOB]|nr:beta-ketoacyl-ACP synthase III [Nitrospira sp. NTP2]MDL1890062.1 beta-ketoacyl-ACP synthase III [Nitrospirales bacterium NOB]RIK56836.1 MAG: 3-oxoacyl-ACP synthase [Nitrospira sp.]